MFERNVPWAKPPACSLQQSTMASYLTWKCGKPTPLIALGDYFKQDLPISASCWSFAALLPFPLSRRVIRWSWWGLRDVLCNSFLCSFYIFLLSWLARFIHLIPLQCFFWLKVLITVKLTQILSPSHSELWLQCSGMGKNMSLPDHTYTLRPIVKPHSKTKSEPKWHCRWTLSQHRSGQTGNHC